MIEPNERIKELKISILFSQLYMGIGTILVIFVIASIINTVSPSKVNIISTMEQYSDELSADIKEITESENSDLTSEEIKEKLLITNTPELKKEMIDSIEIVESTAEVSSYIKPVFIGLTEDLSIAFESQPITNEEIVKDNFDNTVFFYFAIFLVLSMYLPVLALFYAAYTAKKGFLEQVEKEDSTPSEQYMDIPKNNLDEPPVTDESDEVFKPIDSNNKD